jgi:hypothetical protein
MINIGVWHLISHSCLGFASHCVAQIEAKLSLS